MADIIKKSISKIFSLFSIPKIHPKLYNMEKEAEKIALLGEINTENINPMSEPPKWMREHFKGIKKEDIKLYIDGKEYSGYEVTQMQRRLESSVRNEKTTRELARASGDKTLVKRCNERIKAYQGKYAGISEITKIPEDKKRMSVPRKPKTN